MTFYVLISLFVLKLNNLALKKEFLEHRIFVFVSGKSFSFTVCILNYGSLYEIMLCIAGYIANFISIFLSFRLSVHVFF